MEDEDDEPPDERPVDSSKLKRAHELDLEEKADFRREDPVQRARRNLKALGYTFQSDLDQPDAVSNSARYETAAVHFKYAKRYQRFEFQLIRATLPCFLGAKML